MDRRTATIWTYGAVGLAGGIGLMVLPMALPGVSGPARILTWTATSALSVVWGFGLAWLLYRKGDEFEREASKFAWHWGGTAGLAISAPIYVFVMLGGLHWLDPNRPMGRDLARAFGEGYGLAIVAQLLGFLAAYAWWKAAKR